MITLKIDETSLEKSRSSLITGKIYFDCGAWQFPEINWDDFVVVVLSWWLSAVHRLLTTRSDVEELLFMDGPFFVAIKNLGDDQCHLEGFRRGATKAVFADEVSLKRLHGVILKAARQIEAACTARQWENDDIRQLRSAIRTSLNVFP